MASIEELRKLRIGKKQKIVDFGMEIYSPTVPRDISLKNLNENFETLEKENKELSLAGRIMAIRGQGAILFVVLQDGDSQFQAVFKKDEIEEKLFELFSDAIDMGDFISVTGTLFITERGQESLLVKEWRIASKALLPLPEKWAGLQDIEEKYRKRYLDLISDKETYQRFQKRSEIIKAIRMYFDTKGFMEVETPILQNQAGGAMAETFNTHHNDLDMDMVLRISLELEHKMIMAGGYQRIYEIGKNFRNEGSDPTHIQEFTMMEWYSAYNTLEDNMNWTEELLKMLARDVMKKTKFKVWDKEGEEVEVDFKQDFKRVKFNDLLKENAKIEITSSMEEIKEKAKEFGMKKEEIEKTGKGNLLDFIYKKSARKNIIQATFVMNYPSELKPLAQQNEDGTAEVCQLIIAGAEMTNQYAELIDPEIQRKLLEEQEKAKEGGDKEAMDINEGFLMAMEHGMPPMTGFGMGIDRLVALFTEQKNLRDVIFFPIMRGR